MAATAKLDVYSENWIAQTYGALVPTAKVARLLGFPTAAAFRRAQRTGRLPLSLFTIRGRRGLFASAKDIAGYLQDANDGVRPMTE